MKTINNYEIGFTKKEDREKVEAMAKFFFESDYKLDLEKLPTEEGESIISEICDQVSDSAIQTTETISLVARNLENGDILGFLSAETYRRDGILIKFIITNKEYQVSLIYKDFLIGAIQQLVQYFGKKRLMILLADKNQKGVAFVKRTFKTQVFDMGDQAMMEIFWPQYFFENNIKI